MAAEPPLDEATLRSISEILGDTHGGLTNTEIDRLLREVRIPDPTPRSAGPGTYIVLNKRDRLHRALAARQQADGSANAILKFVKHVMSPARYIADPDAFDARRHRLNVALAFRSLELAEDGRLIRRTRAATTLTEARRAAQRLRETLKDRGAHPRLMAACVDEIRDSNYFHAVLEASKSLTAEIQRLTGLADDGWALLDAAFEKGQRPMPLLVLNTLESPTERSRQQGLAAGLRAIYSAARNPTAHEPKVLGTLSEVDALDHLTQISYLHRQIDRCTFTGNLYLPEGAACERE
jgi:uncharacterized protein (TIGR02391 family)